MPSGTFLLRFAGFVVLTAPLIGFSVLLFLSRRRGSNYTHTKKNKCKHVALPDLQMVYGTHNVYLNTNSNLLSGINTDLTPLGFLCAYMQTGGKNNLCIFAH